MSSVNCTVSPQSKRRDHPPCPDPQLNFVGDLGPLSENTPLLPGGPRAIDDEIDDLTTAFWEECWYLTKSTLPVFVSNLLEYSLIISIISIGHISTKHLAAAALGSMTGSVTGFSVVIGFCSALDTVLPSAWTSSTPQLVGLWTQRMAVIMVVADIPIIMLWRHAEPVFLLLRQDPEIAELAALYLRWMSLSVPSFTFNILARRYFQSQGRFTAITRIIMVEVPINILLNYLLVWGPEPIRLGFIGSPIATSIAVTLTSALYIAYGLFFVPKTAWHPFSMHMFEKLGFLTRIGFASFSQVASEWWSWELAALAASFLGPVALASQSVLMLSTSMTWQAASALSITVSVRIGNLFGELRAMRAKISAYASFLLAVIVSVVWSVMFLTCRKFWARMFNDDPEVISLVASVIPLLALSQIFDSVNTVMCGVLRAQEKQFIGALLSIGFYYIFGIPLGLWLTFSCHIGLKGLWIGLIIAVAALSVCTTFVCLRSDWDKELKKVLARIAEDQKFMDVGGA